MEWWGPLAIGVAGTLIATAIIAMSVRWTHRPRIEVDGLFMLNPHWYIVHVHNRGSRPVHVFEVGLIRGDRRYKSAETGIQSEAGHDVEKYSSPRSVFDAEGAERHLEGEPAECYAIADGLVRGRREYRGAITRT